MQFLRAKSRIARACVLRQLLPITTEREKPMVTKITRQELQAKLARGESPVLLEALPAKYYRPEHLPGARNMPHDQVDALAPVLAPDKDAEIVVYCANLPCRNSEIAAERLVALGYTRVREYAEGKADWKEAGLPLERSTDDLAA
jgi:rhodanese-related sulfurtransferase